MLVMEEVAAEAVAEEVEEEAVVADSKVVEVCFSPMTVAEALAEILDGNGLTSFAGAMPHQFRPPPPPPPPPPVARRAPPPTGARAYDPRMYEVKRYVKDQAVPVAPQRTPRQNPRLSTQMKENLGPAAVALRARENKLREAAEASAKASASAQVISETAPPPPPAPRVASPVPSTKSIETAALSAKTATTSLVEQIKAKFASLAPYTDHLPNVPVSESATPKPATPAFASPPVLASPVPRTAALPKSAPSTNGARVKVRESAAVAYSPAKLRAIVAAETPDHDGVGQDAQLLTEARQQIARDMVRLGAKPDSEEASGYLAKHKHRAWLMQAAIDAVNDVSPENLADHTVQAIVEHAAIVRQKAESLPSPPLSAERGRTSARSGALRSLGAPPSLKVGGVISVDYYDSEGTFHKNERFNVSQPVNASVTVTAKAGEYDPLGMAAQMEALAKRMVQHF